MKKIIKIIGMDCPSCAMLIESELEDAGIKAKVSYAKETLEVESIDKKSFLILSKKITELGYKLSN